MEVKQFVTFAVTIILGVVLISGLVVPAIGGLGSGGGGSGPSSDATYTNTGDIYLKSPSAMTGSEEHAIGFTVQNNKVQLRYDGELFTEKNVNGTDSFYIPIIIQPNEPEEGYQAIIFERSVFDGTPEIAIHTYLLDDSSEPGGWYMGSGSDAMTLSQNGDTIEFQTDSVGYSATINGVLEDEDIPYILAFSYNEGDWVLADNPIVNPNKEFYIFDASPITSDNNIYQQTFAYGRGNIDFFTEFYIDECGSAYDSQNDLEFNAYTNENAYLNIPATTADTGVRLGNLELTAEFVVSDEPLFTTNATFNTYIVPKTVSNTQNGWLTDDFSNVPNEGLSVYARMGSNSQVGIFMEKTNSGIR